MSEHIRLVEAGDCICCHIRNRGAPAGDLGLAFLSGYLQTKRPVEYQKQMIAKLCPQHGMVWAAMERAQATGIIR